MWKDIRRSWWIAYPIIIGNVVQNILGVIDSAMVGSIHSTQLAAASLVNSVLAIPTVFGFGLSMAIGPLVSNAIGEGNKDKPLRLMYNGLLVALIWAIILGLSFHLGSGVVFHLGQDEVVAEIAEPYLIWMGWSMIPFILFMTVKQFSEGLEFTRTPMIIAVFAVPLNILLNYIFIFGKWGAPRMELEGAGVGTVVSRAVILIILVWVIFTHKNYAPFRRNVAVQLKFKWTQIREVIRIGIPSGMQYGMESGAFALSGLMVGWIGAQQQAAHQVGVNLASLAFMVSLGLSSAASIRVGQAFGRKDWSSARMIGRNIMFMGGAYGLLMAIFFVTFRNQLPYIFNDEIDVVVFAASLLVLAAIFQISDSVQAITVGLLRGLQDVKIPTFIVGIAYWAIGIPAGYYLAFKQGMESRGVWLGLVIGLTFSAIMLVSRFFILTRKRMLSQK